MKANSNSQQFSWWKFRIKLTQRAETMKTLIVCFLPPFNLEYSGESHRIKWIDLCLLFSSLSFHNCFSNFKFGSYHLTKNKKIKKNSLFWKKEKFFLQLLIHTRNFHFYYILIINNNKGVSTTFVNSLFIYWNWYVLILIYSDVSFQIYQYF